MRKYCRKNNKTVKIIGVKIPQFLFISGILVVSVFTVFFTVQTVTSSAKLAYLENEEYQLIKKNEELNNTLIDNSSLTSLSKSAGELGFVKPVQTFLSDYEKEVAKLP